MSRDRGTAYAAAATKSGKTQVADGFHLVQNIHQTIKDALSLSNGPMEGTNNKIKMMRRRGYGRAGIELINALAVLPRYYKDLDENCELQNKSAA